MELPEVGVPLGHLRQPLGQSPDEVEREVEPLEGLAGLQVLDPLDRVHAQVEVLQTAQPGQVLYALDAVVLFEFRAKYEMREAGIGTLLPVLTPYLQEEDPEVGAGPVDVLDLGEVRLVQRQLVQRGEVAVVVLRPQQEQLVRYAAKVFGLRIISRSHF